MLGIAVAQQHSLQAMPLLLEPYAYIVILILAYAILYYTINEILRLATSGCKYFVFFFTFKKKRVA
jgi:hypothetical protein